MIPTVQIHHHTNWFAMKKNRVSKRCNFYQCRNAGR